MVSLFQKAREKQIPLPMAAAQLRRRDAASTRAASDQTVARLSSETIRWYQISSGLAAKMITAAAANGRRKSSRRASTYTRAQLTRVAQSTSARGRP